jgi:predicted GIY-YIG superfamily endonuclease
MRSKWLVYILRCKGGSLYTGITNDLPRRLEQHRAGLAAKYTAARRPVRLVYTEPSTGRPRALRREAAIKSLSRAQKIKLIHGVGR